VEDESMKLYFSPLACSMASRIALYASGAEAELIQVNTKTKRTADGGDFLLVNPLGLVPVLRTDDGAILTENSAVLQFIADRHPEAMFAPRELDERARLHQWLSFIGTELHKGIFVPLLDKAAHEAVHAYARAKASSRLSWVAARLEGREFVLDAFSIADAYLFTVLNWAAYTQVALDPWPAIVEYMRRMRAHPAVARAFEEEKALYLQEQEARV
jgi:glutathione S-transferase